MGKLKTFKEQIESGKISISNALELVRKERTLIKKGLPVEFNLDTIQTETGLSARESSFCWLLACAKTSADVSPTGFKTKRSKRGDLISASPADIALQCGFSRGDVGALLCSHSIRSAIREYTLQVVAVNDNAVEDLRSIALNRLSASASANIADLVEYVPYAGAKQKRSPIVSSAGTVLNARAAVENQDNIEGGGGGYPQETGGGPADREVAHRPESSFLSPNFSKSDGISSTEVTSLPAPSDGYYGYMQLADGSMARIKRLEELPNHVSMAIKSFKIRNEGSKQNPLFVPEIEFYDGVRAAELLLKYTGDIGAGRAGDDVVGMIGDVVDMIDSARRRSNERQKAERTIEADAEVTEVTFVEPDNANVGRPDISADREVVNDIEQEDGQDCE